MIKIGVLGAGHLGKIHLRLLKEIPEFELIGFYDPDEKNAIKVEEQMGIKHFESMQQLIDLVDAVDIVTPTLSHYDCATQAIRQAKHVFIEKPLTTDLKEAESLVQLVAEADVKAQVGHVERFNPAFLSIQDMELYPLFIETHRLAQFNPRGTDVSVILDLMIHDIDIILSIVPANVKNISASGVPIISETPDIANARIEFDNGCVANITASRISFKNMRKMRIFQPDAYITLDFLEKKTEIFEISNTENPQNDQNIEIDLGASGQKKYISFKAPELDEVNSIKMELELFYKSITEDLEPAVSVLDGFNAMKVAYSVMEKIQKVNISGKA